MTDKELRKLSRADLLSLLLEQSKRLRELEDKYKIAEKRLENKNIILNNAGSIAEAALQLNGVFEAAEAACRQYTENIAAFSARRSETEREYNEKAALIVEEAKKRAETIENDARLKSEEMLEKARRESQAYWDSVNVKLDKFMAEHDELKKILSVSQLKRNEQL